MNNSFSGSTSRQELGRQTGGHCSRLLFGHLCMGDGKTGQTGLRLAVVVKLWKVALLLTPQNLSLADYEMLLNGSILAMHIIG